MKVKTFTAFTENGLDEKMNEFLNDKSIEIIDIKFGAGFSYLSAMIVYKNK